MDTLIQSKEHHRLQKYFLKHNHTKYLNQAIPEKINTILQPVNLSAAANDAFKKIWKYAVYLDKVISVSVAVNSESDAQNWAFLDELIQRFEQQKYKDIVELFDARFDKSDWHCAVVYFKRHPEAVYAGFKAGLMYSYVKIPYQNVVLRRLNVLGFGIMGRVKLAISQSSVNSTNDFFVIKRVDLSNQDGHWLMILQNEARINYDLKLSSYDAVIDRRFPPGQSSKVYLVMQYLGMALSMCFSNINEAQRMQYAIDFLIKLRQLHQGKNSRSNTAYAHRDIKPQNIVISLDESIEIIDNGFATPASLHYPHSALNGTPRYMPKSFNLPLTAAGIAEDLLDLEANILKLNVLRAEFQQNPVQVTPNYYFDDKIAALRTIYHPLYAENSIFTTGMFLKLPRPVQNLFDTHNISQCIKNSEKLSGEKHSVEIVVAVLIYIQWIGNSDVEKILKAFMEKNKIIDYWVQFHLLMRNMKDKSLKLINQSVFEPSVVFEVISNLKIADDYPLLFQKMKEYFQAIPLDLNLLQFSVLHYLVNKNNFNTNLVRCFLATINSTEANRLFLGDNQRDASHILSILQFFEYDAELLNIVEENHLSQRIIFWDLFNKIFLNRTLQTQQGLHLYLNKLKNNLGIFDREKAILYMQQQSIDWHPVFNKVVNDFLGQCVNFMKLSLECYLEVQRDAFLIYVYLHENKHKISPYWSPMEQEQVLLDLKNYQGKLVQKRYEPLRKTGVSHQSNGFFDQHNPMRSLKKSFMILGITFMKSEIPRSVVCAK